MIDSTGLDLTQHKCPETNIWSHWLHWCHKSKNHYTINITALSLNHPFSIFFLLLYVVPVPAYLSVILTSLVMVHARYLARAASYSGVPSFPNLRARSSGKNRPAALEGSISRKSSSSMRSCMMGWWRAAVKNTWNAELKCAESHFVRREAAV